MRSLPIIQNDDFVSSDLCGPCGGKCCQNYPGAAFPSDFGTTEQEIASNLLDALMTGKWAIDQWDGNFPYQRNIRNPKYVRPATQGDEGHIFDKTWGGKCTFWSKEKGCGIFEKRPLGCRGLKPGKEGSCKVQYGSKEDAIEAWIPYRKMLNDLLSLFDYIV